MNNVKKTISGMVSSIPAEQYFPFSASTGYVQLKAKNIDDIDFFK